MIIGKKKKTNQKGFSLIEVLCAIVLLTLVATPLIQIIFSSFTLNNKSKKMLAAADLTSDAMEYISSLAFDDYTYTPEGAAGPTTIVGANKCYWSETVSGYNTLLIHNADDTYSVFPGGPVGNFASYTKNSGYREIVLSNVDYNGYKYRVSVMLESKMNVATDKYYVYEATVKVYDNTDTSYCYSEASTNIPNKY